MIQYSPLHSLKEGSWFKLICGASYQHLPAVRNLALAYSLAGADCIDVAADPAVIAAAREGIRVAEKVQQAENQRFSEDRDCYQFIPQPQHLSPRLPWLMASINDGEDPHFRKAEFDVNRCPSYCSQPCVGVCPADAIAPQGIGVIEDLCYGCGRCLPICPEQIITTRSHVSNPRAIASLIESRAIDALEIHTQPGHYNEFRLLWQEIQPSLGNLKLLAISCTDGDNVIAYLRSLYDLISPFPHALIWQTDGRSMSGDIGRGTTHAAIAFAQKVLQANLPGYIQLAGGTNDLTVTKLNQLLLLRQQNQSPPRRSIAGVAYGSYARTLLLPILNSLEKTETTELQNIQSNLIKNQPMNQLNLKLERDENLLKQAVSKASQLVNQIKRIS